MKDKYTRVSLVRLCRLLGVTRQAYYQHFWQREAHSIEEQLVLEEVKSIRQYHKYMGTRKLYAKLGPFMQEDQIKMGRDALFDLLSAHQMLVRKKKRSIYTTQSFHWLRTYPNLIRDFIPVRPNELWVSDIVNNKFMYISLVIDAFSRYIVGYHVAETLAAVETIEALKMALAGIANRATSDL